MSWDEAARVAAELIFGTDNAAQQGIGKDAPRVYESSPVSLLSAEGPDSQLRPAGAAPVYCPKCGWPRPDLNLPQCAEEGCPSVFNSGISPNEEKK